MSQYQNTFKRYEMKYLLDEKTYKALMLGLQDKLRIDQYGKTTICNIYYDTPEHLLVQNSLEKPIYKEKLRVRSYGTPTDTDEVFVELKKKYDGVVYKRREKMELSAAEDYLYRNKPAMQSTQIIREIDWFLRFYKNLQPAMYLSYSRIAMYGLEDSELRVTFDSNIRWREENLNLKSGYWGFPLLKAGTRLMEIKIPGSMPIWLSQILNNLEIYPVSFSKYGEAFKLAESVKKTKEGMGVMKYA